MATLCELLRFTFANMALTRLVCHTKGLPLIAAAVFLGAGAVNTNLITSSKEKPDLHRFTSQKEVTPVYWLDLCRLNEVTCSNINKNNPFT